MFLYLLHYRVYAVVKTQHGQGQNKGTTDKVLALQVANLVQFGYHIWFPNMFPHMVHQE